jgi:hypothetical protein
MKIRTDSRLLLVLIVFTVFESADQSVAADLQVTGVTLLRRILNAIEKDTPTTIKIILEGLAIIRQQPACEALLGTKVFDVKFLEKVLGFYEHEDEQVRAAADVFFQDHARHLAEVLSKSARRGGAAGGSGGGGGGASGAKAAAALLLSQLAGHKDLRHREVLLLVHNVDEHLFYIKIILPAEAAIVLHDHFCWHQIFSR